MDTPAKNQGFTLMELLLVIVLIGLAATLSVPSMRGFLQNLQLKNNIILVESQLLDAYSGARNRGETITITAEKSAENFIVTRLIAQSVEPVITTYELEGNTEFSEAVQITYVPPFGDIVWDENQEAPFEVTLQSEKIFGLRVWPVSGLVERFFKPNGS